MEAPNSVKQACEFFMQLAREYHCEIWFHTGGNSYAYLPRFVRQPLPEPREREIMRMFYAIPVEHEVATRGVDDNGAPTA